MISCDGEITLIFTHKPSAGTSPKTDHRLVKKASNYTDNTTALDIIIYSDSNSEHNYQIAIVQDDDILKLG